MLETPLPSQFGSASALLSPAQVGHRLGVSARTLAKWRSTRLVDLPYVKIGARVFYRSEDVERFIAAHVVVPSRGGQR